jgi:hypothetical protein
MKETKSKRRVSKKKGFVKDQRFERIKQEKGIKRGHV